MVTGYDLSVQLWNINDGSNLIQVQPQLYSTTLAHTYANLPRSISTVTYETVNYGEQKHTRKYIFIGNEYGNICGYQEANSAIEDVPVMFFRIGDTTKNQVEYYRSLAEENEGITTNKDPHLRSFVKQMIHKKHSKKPTAPVGPAPSSNKFIDTKSLSTVSRHDVFDREGLACTDHAVLWVKYIENSPNLLVAYLSGTVTFWNLEKNVRTHDLSFADMGPVLEGMKLKTSDKILTEPPEAVAKYLPTPGTVPAASTAEDNNRPEDPVSEGADANVLNEVPFADLTVKIPNSSDVSENPSSEPMQLKKAVVKLQTQRRVSAAFLHKARVKKEAPINLPTVAESLIPSLPPASDVAGAVPSDNIPVAVSDSGPVAPSSVVEVFGSVSVLDDISSLGAKSDEFIGLTEPSSEVRAPAVLPPLAHGKRRDSAAAVVKSFNPNRKNVLLPRRSVSMNVSDNYGSVELDAYQQPHNPLNKSSVSSASTTSLDSPSHPLQVTNSVQSIVSNATDGSSYSSSTMATNDPTAQQFDESFHSAPKITVECVAVLIDAQVIIGACSDKYMRFWDLSSHHILCSCCYYHRTDAEQEALNKNHSNETAGHSHHHHRHHTFLHKNGAVLGGTMRHHQHHHHNGKQGSGTGDEAGHAHKQKSKTDSAPVDEVLRLLKVSDSEDLLIGAYDNGVIRLWSIQSYSIVTLRSLLSKHQNKDVNDGTAKDNNFGYGLAISPITLLFEWTAHRSPILSSKYLTSNVAV